MKISFLKIIFVLVFGFLFFSPFVVLASSTDNMSGWAWSSNIGWISMNCTNDNSCATSNYGVNKDANGNLVGYAWSSNIGWIQFGNLSGFPSGSGTQSQNANLNGNNLKGWVKALSADGNGWDGWISLSGSNPSYGVTLDQATNKFSGYTWGSEVVGWVSFSGSNYGVIIGAAVLPPLTCGTNAKTYTTETAWPAGGLFCAIGEPKVAGGNSCSGNGCYDSDGENSIKCSDISTKDECENGGGTWTPVVYPIFPVAGTTVNWNCAATNGVLVACSASKEVNNLSMAGTLTATNCAIAFGASSCDTTLSWSIENTEAIPTEITNSDGVNKITLSTPTIGNSYLGTKTYTFTSPSSKTFFLYNNAKSLVPDSPNGLGIIATATCNTGSSWNRSKCVENISVTLSAAPTSIRFPANSTTLTWKTTGSPNSCIASNAWSGSKTASGGSASITGLTAGTHTYTLTCSKPGTSNVSASRVVTVTAPAGSCTAPWGELVLNGRSVTAYKSPSVTSPKTCVSVSQVRSCNNGILSGSDVYSNGSCVETIRPGSDSCSSPAVRYTCSDGQETDNKGSEKSSPSNWTWKCGNDICSQKKSPGYIEN